MTGKKTDRLLLRMDEETALEIRMQADAEQRSLQGHLRKLLTEALEHRRLATGVKKRLIRATSERKEKAS